MKFINRLIILLCLALPVAGQDSTSRLMQTLQQLSTKESRESIDKYKQQRISVQQSQTLDELKVVTQRTKLFLKSGIDSLAIRHDIKLVTDDFKILQVGVLYDKESTISQRNYTVSAVILSELINLTADHKEHVDAYVHVLVQYRSRIDSLSSDSTLFVFSSDSAKAVKYLKRLAIAAREISPIDSAVDKHLGNLQEIGTTLDQLLFELRLAGEEIEVHRANLSKHTMHREFPNLLASGGNYRPLGRIVQISYAKEQLAWKFYLQDNKGKLLLWLVLIVMSSIFLYTLRKKYRAEHPLQEEAKEQLVIRYPILTAIVIVSSIYQFVFIDAPFIFSCGNWWICAICLAIIFKNHITSYWWRFWVGLVCLFTLACFDNLILLASLTERWCIFLLAAIGAVFSAVYLINNKRHELREKRILYFIAVMGMAQVISIGFNLLGRYNLSKTFMTSGFIGLVIAILFLWTIRFINEGLKIASLIYKRPDKQLLYINFDKVGEKAPSIFYVLLVVGWFILMGRNFYGFRQFTVPFNNFLNQERTVGDYTFTVNGLFVFVLIFICAMVLSKLISFFAYDHSTPQSPNNNQKRVALGSWLLLVRIFVISTGLFLAIAASGIPLDKITIILGALSVGIGLGLQSLVTNLVSGLIIAFEKPVNVGDYIEVNGKAGTMKEIGFRSSVVTLLDGANLVIPNGDLLKDQLVNWSLSKNNRRVHIPVGVAYGTDLEKAQAVLMTILQKDERVLGYPAPLVIAQRFGESSIDLEMMFWIHHWRDTFSVTNDMILAVDREFKQAGIEIPFPQQDLHIIQQQKNEPSQ
ncbi:mechanosensitive ion channel-like protein [Chitinophaga skermanii]|uniref:Mechanosensitive ion channel-like protein n=1 Tax=Chitinophaga skermanii TaxID=331697 RepID=A0A327Q3A7_9BACT|nr:mechanosensitive ion channel domain-containing protein [Chitinophaga skermanii]RAI97672.1 mechanosensitive ion channel-like protein [Chitinophaga skermanii]